MSTAYHKEYIQKHPEVDWHSIEGLRHILVHDYYTVNMEMVWAILQKDLPKLKQYLLSDTAKGL